jgi:hypothetical protein
MGILLTMVLLLAALNPAQGMNMTDDDPTVSQDNNYAFVRFIIFGEKTPSSKAKL